MEFTKDIIADIEKAYKRKEELLGDFLIPVSEKISKLPDNEKYGMKFVYGYAPLSDMEEENYDIFLESVRHAFFTRENTPWGKDIPFDLFLVNVLSPRASNEKLENHRKYFFDLVFNRIKDKSMYDAVIEANYFCFENATYAMTDRRTAPPSTLMKSGIGRCGEEAVFTVSILRSLGIPARSMYTPRWAHTDNNHAWVEAWCDGKWYYLGACEPEEVLDRGWFTSAASRAMLIESRAIYHNRELNPEVEAIKDGLIYTLNATDKYANVKKNTITVLDKNNKPINGAEIHFEIVNHSEFSRLNTVVTDENGVGVITTGLGSLNIHIVYENKYMEKLINTEDVNDITIIFEPEVFEEKVVDFDTYAPKDPGNKVISLEKAIIDNHIRKYKNAENMRKDKYSEIADINKLKHENMDKEEIKEILNLAKLNGNNIIKFLNDNGEYGLKLLKTLEDKDYSDLDPELLSIHLNEALVYKYDFEEDIFVNYILNPRIYFEQLSLWRKYINEYFSEEIKKEFKNDPEKIWDYINENIKYLKEEEFLNTVISPVGALKIGYASPMAKKTLFVAICRSLGIPSRITRDTMDIEYLVDGKFISPIPDEIRDSNLEIDFEEKINWVYGTNWSIGVLEDGVYQTLMLRNTNIDESLNLRSGKYRIITANRLPNGDIFGRKYYFELETGKTRKIEIGLRPIEIDNLINPVELGDFYIKTMEDKEILISTKLKENNTIIWLEDNSEPCHHVLNEMIDYKKAFEDINVLFIVEDKDIKDELILKAIDEVGVTVLIDEEFRNLEPTGRRTYIDHEKLPMVVLTKDGLNSIYALSGYNVGTADLITKLFA